MINKTQNHYYIYRKANGKPDLLKNIKYRAERKLDELKRTTPIIY